MSTTFNEEGLFPEFVGIGVSQLLEIEWCPLIEGIFKDGGGHFMREDGASEEIVG